MYSGKLLRRGQMVDKEHIGAPGHLSGLFRPACLHPQDRIRKRCCACLLRCQAGAAAQGAGVFHKIGHTLCHRLGTRICVAQDHGPCSGTNQHLRKLLCRGCALRGGSGRDGCARLASGGSAWAGSARGTCLGLSEGQGAGPLPQGLGKACQAVRIGIEQGLGVLFAVEACVVFKMGDEALAAKVPQNQGEIVGRDGFLGQTGRDCPLLAAGKGVLQGQKNLA